MKPKRLISLLVAVCMVVAMLPVSAFAAENPTSGPCGDNVTWALTEDNNGDYTLTISGTGAMTDYSKAASAPWSWAKHRIRAIAIGDEITAIGAYAFMGCDRFYTITIPASVTTICQGAFQSCTSLETVDLSNAINLKTINSDAFYYCYNLNEVTIPSSVTSIGSNAFRSCIGLKRVTLLNGVQEIGGAAFLDCNSLKYVDIPESVTKIDASAFAYCSTLESIAIPASVKEIGNGAFTACINLKTITFVPNSQLMTVGNNVFNTCYAKIYCESALADVLNGKTGDATIVSQVTVKISYDGIGGEDTEITVDYPAQVKEPATPSAEGYTFLGWYDENGNAFDFSKPVTQNTIVTAKWVKDHQLTVKGGTFTVDGKAVEENPADVPEGAKVVVTFDESILSDAQTFDQWTISSSDILNAVNPNNKTIEFTMPEEGLTVEAMTKDASIEDSSDALGTVAVVGALGVGTAVLAYQGYMLGTEFWLNYHLPYGVDIPANRAELAQLVWDDAGRPEPAAVLNADASNADKALVWAVENQLMAAADKNGEVLTPDASVSRVDVIRTWKKYEQMKAQ